MRRLFACVGLCVSAAFAAAPAFADMYGFVDENGIARFGNSQVDSRSTLFMRAPKEVVAAEPERAVPQPAAYATSAMLGKPYEQIISDVAREQGVEPALLHAVITVESAYNPWAKSRRGASGLMQLIPATAKRFGVADIWDPLENIRGGARYLRELLARFNDDMQLVLAAYNAGEGAVMRAGNRIPPYRETRAYVPRVMELYARYRSPIAL